MRVRDLAKPLQVAELAFTVEPPFELAVSSTEPDRLLLLQARGGSTIMRVFALPEPREVIEARLSLKGESHLVALVGSVAVLLGGTESLTAVDLAKLRASPLPVRGPIQVVAQFATDAVLVGARGKLEAWSLDERRPTHRLGLALPKDAAFGGVIANGRLLWVASAAAPGTVSLFRLSDGKPLASTIAGGAIKAIVGDPASTTVVAAIEPEGGRPLELVALELESQVRRPMPFDGTLAAFCLAGAPADAVAILADAGEPVLLPLATSAIGGVPRPVAIARPRPAESSDEREPGDEAEGEPAAAAPTEPAVAVPSPAPDNDLASRMSQWRAQVQAAVVAAPPRPAPLVGGVRTPVDEPRSRSRAELYAWGLSARARTTTTPPPPPQGWRIVDLTLRFKLDLRTKSLLSLLYAAWLDGAGEEGVPVGVIARALGNDEEAWVEALAQGRLGRMGWIKTGHGKTRLRGVIGRFLDEAPPRVTLVTPSELDPEQENPPAPIAPPVGLARWHVGDRAALAAKVREVADLVREPVSMIDAHALPAARFQRLLATRLLEARLHGALPIVLPTADLDLQLLDGPTLLAVDDAMPAAWSALPVWPPPVEAEAASVDAVAT